MTTIKKLRECSRFDVVRIHLHNYNKDNYLVLNDNASFANSYGDNLLGLMSGRTAFIDRDHQVEILGKLLLRQITKDG